ncbi:MAG: nucleotidyltransferase domain-containing protein [Bacillota bacterium]|nr:nucleotidyltransferase domain-containing protein [Bacillota bacterium]
MINDRIRKLVNRMVRLGKPGMINLNKAQIDDMVRYIESRGDIIAFYLYGSHGTEYQTVFSDVDLAILPMPASDFDFNEELNIMSKLNDLGNSDDINLVNLKKAPVTLQMKVLDSGRLLYCADAVLLADFIESVILKYSDFEPDLRLFNEDYDYSLKKEYL